MGGNDFSILAPVKTPNGAQNGLEWIYGILWGFGIPLYSIVLILPKREQWETIAALWFCSVLFWRIENNRKQCRAIGFNSVSLI